MKSTLILLLLSTLSLLAKPLQGVASKDSVTIGEIFQFTVPLPNDKATLKEYDEWRGTLRIRKVIQYENNFIFSLSAYGAPLCTIPSFQFSIEGDSTKLITEPKEITVITTVTDSTNASHEFRSPMKAGKFPLYLTILALGGAALIIALIVFLLSRKKGEKEEDIIIIPPYDEAMSALTRLEDQKLLDKGEFKPFTFGLSEILKRYISRQFEAQIQEATATEFRAWLQKSPLTGEQKQILETFIMETEPVKFANITPPIATFEKLIADVHTFCDETKPVETTEEPKEEVQS